MKLVFSRLALDELDEILSYIAERSPSGAARVEARMRRAFEHIGRYPQAAERVVQRSAVRRLPLIRYPYVVYYEVGAGEVTIPAYPARRPTPAGIIAHAGVSPWRVEDARKRASGST
jgi:toxin ParE1/3/4